MKAKSTLLKERRRLSVASKKRGKNRATPRLPHAIRRAQILSQAAEFFAEFGLTAQTRALAAVCGISQRLLYRFFPNKSALIEEIYKTEIAGPFKAVWFAELCNRSTPIEERLSNFYREYYDQVLTQRWLRLFLYASLADIRMAPAYSSTIVTHTIEVIVQESAHELGLALPQEKALCHELGWALHGAISHLAIRRRIYSNINPSQVTAVIPMYVRVFLAGLQGTLAPISRQAGPHIVA